MDILQNDVQVKRNENADRQKNKAEKRARKDGARMLRGIVRLEREASQDERRSCKKNQNEKQRQSDGFQLSEGFDGVFVVIGVVITHHQNRSPYGERDAGQESKDKIAGQDFFYAQCKDTSFL